MEDNYEHYNPEYIEESQNENNNENIIYRDNLLNQNPLENKSYGKDVEPDYSSLLNKYKILNMDNFKYKNINNEDNNDNINIRDKIINKGQNKIFTDQEMTKINKDYTKQINEIISKNFKNGLDLSQNMQSNSYLNLNKNNNNYLELERERKLLLLKNIELEKEINNLNNFVDTNNKTGFNNNKKLNSNLDYIITNNSNITKNSIFMSNLPSKNKIKKNKPNSSFSYKNINNKTKKDLKRDYSKEINDAQNTIKDLDNKINQLKKEINNNYSIDNRCNDKIKEIKIWRETFYEEYEKYKNLLKDLKENLNNDKILYNNVIWKMKQKASDNINIIYENYKNQIIENDKKLEFLRKENDKLIKKENKVKEIYLYNFNC